MSLLLFCRAAHNGSVLFVDTFRLIKPTEEKCCIILSLTVLSFLLDPARAAVSLIRAGSAHARVVGNMPRPPGHLCLTSFEQQQASCVIAALRTDYTRETWLL